MTAAQPPTMPTSDGQTELSSRSARELLAQVGPIEISTSKPKTLLFHLLGYFIQPLIAILLTAAVISGVSGDWLNAGIIIVIVLGSVGLDFLQTRRSQVAAASAMPWA